MTYFMSARPEHVSTSSIVSFLRLAYSGLSKKKKSGPNPGDGPDWIEQQAVFASSPADMQHVGEEVDPPVIIPDIAIMGPITFARLLTVLAQRGELEEIERWTELPAGTTSTTSLGQVQQMTSESVIMSFVTLAVKRVERRREDGKKSFQEGRYQNAGFEYIAAAELGAALIAFAEATPDGKWRAELRGVRKEVVLSLGNATECALRMKQFEKAYNFAKATMCAIEAWQKQVEDEQVEKV